MTNPTIPILGAAAILLAGCAGEFPYGPGYAGVEYTGYYDDYYGPFYGGYWGSGGYFYYVDRDGRHYHRDTARHFRRDVAPGYHQIHGRTPERSDRRGAKP